MWTKPIIIKDILKVYINIYNLEEGVMSFNLEGTRLRTNVVNVLGVAYFHSTYCVVNLNFHPRAVLNSKFSKYSDFFLNFRSMPLKMKIIW